MISKTASASEAAIYLSSCLCSSLSPPLPLPLSLPPCPRPPSSSTPPRPSLVSCGGPCVGADEASVEGADAVGENHLAHELASPLGLQEKGERRSFGDRAGYAARDKQRDAERDTEIQRL